MKKNINTRLIKTRESYTAEKLSQLLSVHKQTVFNWKKQGLSVIEGTYPLLFMGSIVKEFLDQRQSARKVKLEDNEFYCLKCRKAVTSLSEYIKIIQLDRKVGKNNFNKLIIKGICQNCGTKINKISHDGKLHEIESTFNVIKVEDFNHE